MAAPLRYGGSLCGVEVSLLFSIEGVDIRPWTALRPAECELTDVG